MWSKKFLEESWCFAFQDWCLFPDKLWVNPKRFNDSPQHGLLPTPCCCCWATDPAEQTLLWELPGFLEYELYQKYSEHHKTAKCEKWLLLNKRNMFTTGSQCLNWKAALCWIRKFLYTSFLTYAWNYNESCASLAWVQFSNDNEKLFLSLLKFQNTKPKKILVKVKGLVGLGWVWSGLVWFDSPPDHSYSWILQAKIVLWEPQFYCHVRDGGESF